MIRLSVIMTISLVLIGQAYVPAGGQVSPWPMFRHDQQHTGRSPYTGPGNPDFQWTYQTNDGIASSPAIGPQGTIYVGSGWFWLFNTDSALYAVNPDGSLKWKFYTAKGIFSSPAIGPDGAIYFSSLDYYLYAVEDSVTYGKLRWKTDLTFKLFASPVISDIGTIYMGGLDFVFSAVDYMGNIRWRDTTDWCIFSSAAIDPGGRIYVGSKDHHLYAFDDLGNDYDIAWAHATGTFYDGHLVDASPAIGTDGTIYVGTDQYGAAGQTPIPVDTSFFAINPNGTRKWAFPTDDGVESSPAIAHDGTIYFGSYDSCLYAVRDMGNHGQLLWKYKTGGPIDASPSVGGDGTIYIGSRDSTMYALNPDGSVLWTYEADGDIESSVTVAGDGRIYFGAMDGKLYALGNIGPDVGPSNMDIPSDVPADTTIDPTLTFKNFRTSPQSFQAALLIKDGEDYIYGDTIAIVDLAGGDSTQETFEPWVIGTVANKLYELLAVTIFPEDNNATNDSLNATVMAGRTYVCGDVNSSGTINILDITFLINYVYKGGQAPDPLESGDVNGNGVVNLLDITYLINFVYKGGPAPHCD
jgi:outer membrane protein assembly factor BamB